MLDVSADRGTFKRCIRLVIADRQPIVLEGLKSVFAAQRDFEIVASCSTATSCLEALRNLTPDLALLANTLPDLTISQILTIAKAENLPTRLVFFIESEGDDDLTAAIAADACGAISKYATPDTMLRSLRLMTPIDAPPGRSHELLPNAKQVDEAKIEKMLGVLTNRERQIVRLVSEGLSNKEIARKLNVSRGTVKTHLHNIFQKLEISNRTVLATVALLQRSAGFGTLTLAALLSAVLSEAKASDTNDAFADDDGTTYKDLEHSVFELWKTVILRHILGVDSSEAFVLTQRGSPTKVSEVAYSAAKMGELLAAEQAVHSNFGKGYGPIGFRTPYPFASPLLQATNKSQTDSTTAQQQLPSLEFTSGPTKDHRGYGTFVMTAAGAWIYSFESSNGAMQALDPSETLIDTSTVATLIGTTQAATITVHKASDADAKDVDSPAPMLLVQESHPPLAIGILGHDSVTGEGMAVQIICGGARDDILNGTSAVDTICGGSGNDAIEGNEGDVTIHGGSGSDNITGDNGNDTIIGGSGGDQLIGSNGDDVFVYLSANDSTQFDNIIDFTSGTDKINLAALGALAFVHLTSTSTSVPPHTIAWIYNPTSNETIIYVNPTDRSLDIGDRDLLEIHLQGVMSVAESDFAYEPESSAVGAALEGIDPSLLVATASDGTVLAAGSAHAIIEAEASESELGTVGVWTMPANDGFRFHFGLDRINSVVSARVTTFSDGSAHATAESNDGTVNVPVHVSSVELAHNQAMVTEEHLTFKKELVYPNTGEASPWHGTAHAIAGLELFEGIQSPAIMAPVAAAELAEPGIRPGNGVGHSNVQHASNSAATKAAVPAAPTEPSAAPGHSNSQHASHSASANPVGADEPVEAGVAPGNSAGRGNSQQASSSAVANASAPTELPESGIMPGNGVGHGNAQHVSSSAAAKTSVPADPIEPSVAPGHSNSQHTSHSVSANAVGAAEPVETGVAPGNGAGRGNSQQASQFPAANVSAATELAELASETGGTGNEPAFYFENQPAASISTAAVELEEFNTSPVLGHGGEPAPILGTGPAAMEEHAASHVNNGQHHAIGHLPHELLI
jgi:VCBS repeat-containing protein